MAGDHEKVRVMMDRGRREILVGGGAAAITGVISTTAAQKIDSISASGWDYRTIKELVQALQARKISSSELVEHTIARVQALDGRLNAIVVRDFERAARQPGRRMLP